MKRTNIHLSDVQLAALKALSEKTGLSVAELVRRAVDGYLRREGRDDGGKKRETR